MKKYFVTNPNGCKINGKIPHKVEAAPCKIGTIANLNALASFSAVVPEQLPKAATVCVVNSTDKPALTKSPAAAKKLNGMSIDMHTLYTSRMIMAQAIVEHNATPGDPTNQKVTAQIPAKSTTNATIIALSNSKNT